MADSQRSYRDHLILIGEKHFGMGRWHRPITVTGPRCPHGITLCGRATLKQARAAIDELFEEKAMNERHLRALLERARFQSSTDTKRYTGTLAASFVAANLEHALGLEVSQPDLVMDEAAIERALTANERGYM